MRTELLLIPLVACGGETLSLGAGRDAAALDAAHDAAAGDLAPVVIASLASEGPDDDPALTSDLALLYFNTRRAGGEDIWWTAREGDGWASPQPARELNTDDRETGIALSADGLQIWFSSDREGDLDVYTASRAARSEAFGAPRRVPALSTSDDDLISAVDERGAYLARRASDDGDYDLHFAPREGDGFGQAEPIASLNGDGEESDASPVDEGLLFTRDGDLYLARTQPDGSYRAAPLQDLNSSRDDRDAWATSDLRVVIFSSNRGGSYQLHERRLR